MRDITNSAGLGPDYVIDGPFVRSIKAAGSDVPSLIRAGGPKVNGVTLRQDGRNEGP